MPKCTIDGHEVEFTPGENLVEIAKRVGVEIPYFCYHPGLKVVAQCRMCAVEVEKMPKLQTACSTPATDGMVVKTNTEKTKKNQKAVMEFLLLNHPLDCPICDKSGECDLQDNSFKFGSPYMRSTEERRTYMDLDMGPVIKKNMNRCIHCTRCIRFGEEVAGIHEMVAIRRGNNTEITTIDGRPLETEYAGNYADICPTGSLTLKDFRFKKRAWYLKKTPSICEGCSRGCNIELQQDANVIYRTIPRTHMEVNQYWMCDEGRFHYHDIQDVSRVTRPRIKQASQWEETDWGVAIRKIRDAVHGKKVTVLIGSDLTLEEAALVQKFIPENLPHAQLFHFGTPGVTHSSQDGPADRILKTKSKTSNLRGMEKLGIAPFEQLSAGAEVVVVVSGGRAQIPALQGVKAYGIGVFFDRQSSLFEGILPGLSFAEKDGTVINFQGMEQKFKRAILPLGDSKALSEILMMWLNSSSSAGSR